MNKKNIYNIVLIISIISIISLIYIKFFSKNINIKPFGIEILRVESDSMKPEFSKGDIIIIQEKKEYEVNDIITFQLTDIEKITHRIIEKNENTYYTKGDNNNAKDETGIQKDDIRGKVIYIFN